ncbi:hypothetical protein [Streptomyces sp. H51]|uniref:hypothetical protein n=1 Tax=Streptomyces sp. H51 TaxID=3111770 RepID=UPI002D7A105C|nr:hypothetical protein [Streptomyces sp. H51]
MTRTPARVLVVSALCAGVLPTAAACTAGPAASRQPAPAASRAATTSPADALSSRPLTRDQAQAALLTPADLGPSWTPTQGAATWRDGLLKATAKAPDCRRLLDALYTDDLFGAGARVLAQTGLDDALDGSQLRQQVRALAPSAVDRKLAWMRTLPRECAGFTAATAQGYMQDVKVVEAVLPEAGDARQGLRVTLSGQTDHGERSVLTLDVAVVRAGADTVVVTDGGLGDVSPDTTRTAVETAVRRLTDVRKQGRAEI